MDSFLGPLPPAERYVVQKTDSDGNWIDVPDATYDRATNNLKLPDTNQEKQ